jgi:hypothetical protein
VGCSDDDDLDSVDNAYSDSGNDDDDNDNDEQ